MPQSRHRKSGKVRKKPRGTYVPAGNPRSAKNRSLRIVAMIIVAALGISVIAYVITRRTGSSEVTTASGLRYTDIQEGAGALPQSGQTVTVHYVGRLENGQQFDSSYERGRPLEFQLGVTPMIEGWNEGLRTMKVGGKRKLVVPSALGYGPAGKPPDIPGNSTLVFEVELLGVK